MIELENIYLKTSIKELTCCAPGKFQYYHYKCDGVNDVGWGCGYRTIQTICSWLREQIIHENPNNAKKIANVPSILEIQKILVDSGDKQSKFVGSREWIGCFEAMIVVDTLYDVQCRILHCPESNTLDEINEKLREHFDSKGGPIMMGGNMDVASKGVLGCAKAIENDSKFFLIADPHFLSTSQQPVEVDYLLTNEWISWRDINSFDQNSFYNFCIPQKKANIL